MPDLSIANLLNSPSSSWCRKALIKTADKILGIRELSKKYNSFGLPGLEKKQFTDTFVQSFNLSIDISEQSLLNIPKNGPTIIVANHPFGGAEGVVLANILSKVRPDVKILANKALKIFPELSDFFIFTNPLETGAKGNMSSLRQCQQHLKHGGMLVFFPAGRVSYPESVSAPITDHPWNRIIGTLMHQFKCPVVPCFIGGKNRKRFYWLGHIYFRLRMLMLIREMLASHNKHIPIVFGKPFEIKNSEKQSQKLTNLSRLLTYLQDPNFRQQWPTINSVKLQPLAEPQLTEVLASEVNNLPAKQHLLTYKNYSVYYAYREQCKTVIEEIRRLREKNFRKLDEGSGNSKDGDDLDNTYVHLFVFDHDNKSIFGAYRMGETDKLLQKSGIDGLYLSKMFNFEDKFLNQQAPCLEMGRSFIVADHQRSFHGLLLLFRGICAYVYLYPQYKILYGTVSLSKQYDPLSVLLIEQFLVTKTDKVTPKVSFNHPIHHELVKYLENSISDVDIETLDKLIKQIEPDGKGLPVLVRQYHQLGAVFHCVGIDPNFALTPGLLLSVDLPNAPERLLKLYLGDKLPIYRSKIKDMELAEAKQGASSV